MKTLIVLSATMLFLVGDVARSEPATPPVLVQSHPALTRIAVVVAGQVVEVDGWKAPNGMVLYNESEQRPGWNARPAAPQVGSAPMTGATIGTDGEPNYGLDLNRIDSAETGGQTMYTNDAEFDPANCRPRDPTPPTPTTEYGPIVLIGVALLAFLYARKQAK